MVVRRLQWKVRRSGTVAPQMRSKVGSTYTVVDWSFQRSAIFLIITRLLQFFLECLGKVPGQSPGMRGGGGVCRVPVESFRSFGVCVCVGIASKHGGGYYSEIFTAQVSDRTWRTALRRTPFCAGSIVNDILEEPLLEELWVGQGLCEGLDISLHEVVVLGLITCEEVGFVS